MTPSQLLRKNIRDLKVYKLLVDYGMPVTSEDVAYAGQVLPKSKRDLVKFLVSKCEDSGGVVTDKARVSKLLDVPYAHVNHSQLFSITPQANSELSRVT